MSRTRPLRTAAPANLSTQADRIRHARIACGLTQHQIAQKISAATGKPSTKSDISKWESGKTTNPNIDSFNAFSEITGFSATWLNTGMGESTRPSTHPTLNSKALAAAIQSVLDGCTDHQVELICTLYQVIADGENVAPANIASLRKLIRKT